MQIQDPLSILDPSLSGYTHGIRDHRPGMRLISREPMRPSPQRQVVRELSRSLGYPSGNTDSTRSSAIRVRIKRHRVVPSSSMRSSGRSVLPSMTLGELRQISPLSAVVNSSSQYKPSEQGSISQCFEPKISYFEVGLSLSGMGQMDGDTTSITERAILEHSPPMGQVRLSRISQKISINRVREVPSPIV